MFRLVGMSHYRGTLPGLDELWLRGEARDIPAESAAYLEQTFPGAFIVVGPVVIVTPTLKSPPVRRGR